MTTSQVRRFRQLVATEIAAGGQSGNARPTMDTIGVYTRYEFTPHKFDVEPTEMVIFSAVIGLVDE